MQTTAKKCNHGANIRRWREWRNVNQDVLAEEIGVSQATLSGYEKKETLEQEILDKIAVALNIPVEAITELDNAASINIVSSTLYDKQVQYLIIRHSIRSIKLSNYTTRKTPYMSEC